MDIADMPENELSDRESRPAIVEANARPSYDKDTKDFVNAL